MSSLEVIQTCPTQRRVLLNTLEMVDSNPSTTLRFDIHEIHPRFSYHVDFLFHMECMNNTIKYTVIDEGVVASLMYLSY